MSVNVLREVFETDRITRELLQQVRARGTQIAYDAIKQKAAMGDRDVLVQVDGSSSAQIDAWQKKIRLSWGSQQQLNELMNFVYDAVVRRTPVRTGALAGAWVWVLNGKVLGFGNVRVEALSEGDVLSLFNLKPYIRKAEHGFVAQRTTLRNARAAARGKRAPKGRARGIVESVARNAAAKFRAFSVSFPWLELSGHVVSRRAKDQRIPTVTIRRKGKGITV